MSGSPWPEAMIERLKELWLTQEDGKYLSAAEVGRRMNLSRGKILGKVDRLNLVRPDVVPRTRKLRPVLILSTASGVENSWAERHFQREEPKISKLEDEPQCLAASLPGEWRVRRGEPCCFPIGTPGTKDFRFCDAPSVTGKPYCSQHVVVAYVTCHDRKAEVAYG